MNQPVSKILTIFRSRKFWAAFIGLVFVFLEEFVPDFPFEATQVEQFVFLLIAYIIGVAIEDAGVGMGGNLPL